MMRMNCSVLAGYRLNSINLVVTGLQAVIYIIILLTANLNQLNTYKAPSMHITAT